MISNEQWLPAYSKSLQVNETELRTGTGNLEKGLELNYVESIIITRPVGECYKGINFIWT